MWPRVPQAQSGKTYTMYGPENLLIAGERIGEERGIALRAAGDVFRFIEREAGGPAVERAGRAAGTVPPVATATSGVSRPASASALLRGAHGGGGGGARDSPSGDVTRQLSAPLSPLLPLRGIASRDSGTPALGRPASAMAALRSGARGDQRDVRPTTATSRLGGTEATVRSRAEVVHRTAGGGGAAGGTLGVRGPDKGGWTEYVTQAVCVMVAVLMFVQIR